jgi:hypothetical protein
MINCFYMCLFVLQSGFIIKALYFCDLILSSLFISSDFEWFFGYVHLIFSVKFSFLKIIRYHMNFEALDCLLTFLNYHFLA